MAKREDMSFLGIRLSRPQRQAVEAAAAIRRQTLSELTRTALQRECDAAIKEARVARRRMGADERAER